ncbi:N-acetylglucosamine kinase [Thaumasiovibrio subtropicus]|uniref:N-acetylglucosamine kinase n=1 Tax=Thaumasiovibrio subtropicus TaxID=1891207 RepID=UPI001FE52C39|nr:N-acetylglucosamine kinase [Thaumasiovibrio subtropicus]
MANFKYLVGIDGGGTSCRARITDLNGQLLGEAKTGSANIMLGAEAAMQSILDAIGAAAQQANLSTDSFADMAVGLALAGAEEFQAWQAFMALPHPFAHLTLNTDGYGACLGAWAGKDGAILIAGTGSVGLMIKDGQQHVVGGREFPISDHGSGAIMGLRLIQESLLIADGIKPDSRLAQEVLAHFNHDIDAIVRWSKTAKPRDYGMFSPQIFHYANSGDALAIALLKQTARDIEMLLDGLFSKGAEKACLMGGIAERMHLWLSPPYQARIAQPQGDAMDGALLMAGKSHNLYNVECMV